MKYLKFITTVLAFAFILYYFGIYDGGRMNLRSNQQIESARSFEEKQWETKIDENSSVVIKVTPIELGTDSGLWKFDIVFDTHSGSLDHDMMKVAAMIDDKGNSYSPIAWEGSGPGGHHREGVLIFNAILPPPEYVELKIKDVGGVSERSFKWIIK